MDRRKSIDEGILEFLMKVKIIIYLKKMRSQLELVFRILIKL